MADLIGPRGGMILTGADILLPDPDGLLPCRRVSGLSLAIREGKVAWVGPPQAGAGPVHELTGGVLAAGFVDVQVNGGGGLLLNDSPTAATVATMAEAHRAFGTTALLPTLITDDLATTGAAIAAVLEAIAAGCAGIAGIHLEGPVLGPKRPGVHRPDLFRPLDQDMIDLLASFKQAAPDHACLVTLAPESAPQGAIAALVRRGVKVALGHSDAPFELVRRAIAEGASGFTHLFNAMSPLASREPGMVGAALEDTAAFAGLIMDGAHVHPASARVALKAMGAGRLALVTDAMSAVGTTLDRFDLYGTTVMVRGESCWTPDGVLAGSNLDMMGAVRNAVTLMGVPLETASAMASDTPARWVGVHHRHGSLAVGRNADIVWITDQLKVGGVWQNGTRFV